jgi:PHD/YefM family antitoxin component YafN of YafNO toxin-antitoxin module
VAVFTAEENVLTIQIIKTESGEELVVLPRREYDALMARLGDEEAEDRILADAAQQVIERIKSGEEALVPPPRKSSPT